jgi:L,D-transpeptidase ErfK/SrfK
MRCRLRGPGIVVVLVLVSGCAHLPFRLPRLGGPPRFDEAAFARKPLETFRVPLAPDGATPAETVIGRPTVHRIRDGETLLDVARWYDLGYNEIVEANPGVDPWVPAPGTAVVVPTSWVLPCCTYEGLVLNIPEMRLFSYRRAPGNARQLLVDTYPVGLGRVDRRTPQGKFRVRGKTVNPRWDIPASIRAEHIRERNDSRTFIPGGDPDNPLGKYRLELTIPRYAIHGTNVPWGAGMPVSHGCARLYPEDIEQLFPRVGVGTPVEFLYQAVKVGQRAGQVYVEAHEDLYKLDSSPVGDVLAMLRRQRLPATDRRTVQAALKASRGLPLRLDPGRTTSAAAVGGG